MVYKKSAITLVLAVIINFAVYGHSQCMEKRPRNARCNNIAEQLKGAQKPINDLKKCLIAECLNTSGISMTECVNPPKQNITGSNPLSIDKTLPIEDFLQDILKRTVIHIIHNKEIRKYLNTTCDQKKTMVQINVIRNWIKETQKNLGFSTVIQGSMPPKLTSTGPKSPKDWYDIQIQMLANLSKDFDDMRRYFESSTTCIIPVC